MRDMEVELQESRMNVLRGLSTEELEDYVNRMSKEVEFFLARKTRDLEEVKNILEEKNGLSKKMVNLSKMGALAVWPIKPAVL